MKLEEVSRHLPDPKDLKDAGSRLLENASREVRRGTRQLQESAQDAVDETRRHVKARPLTAVFAVAAAGLALGMMAGWLLGIRRRDYD